MNNSNNVQSLSTPNQKFVSKKTYVITIVVGLVLLVAFWIWSYFKANSAEKTAEVQKKTMKEQAQKQLLLAHEDHLRSLTLPFVWAVRTEMLQGNMSQVNLYMNEMVREKNFQNIAVIDNKGIIKSSTNKKNEGRPFGEIERSTNLEINDTNVNNVGDSILILTSPIMGFNKKLGTLYLKYSIPKLTFQEN